MSTCSEIENLIKETKYAEALAACDEMLAQAPDMFPEVCRLRSWVFTRQADYRTGVDELRPLLDSGKGSISDFHSAALWSLFDGKLTDARDWFSVVLTRGHLEGDTWFDSSALFYLAYLHAELGQYDEAEVCLKRSGDEDVRVMLPRIGAVTRLDLQDFIEAQRSR